MRLDAPERRLAVQLLCFVFAVLPSATAAAEESSKTATEEILEILRDDGTIDEERYETLRQQAEEERSALPPVASNEAEKDPKGWSVKWSNGTRIERNDGVHKLKIGGRIQGDYAYIKPNSTLKGLVPATKASKGSGVEFRRARLFFSGTVYEHLEFKAQYDFAGGASNVKDMYAGLVKLGPIARIRGGHFKEPFSLEEMTSSKYNTFIERSLLAATFNPVRNMGVEISSQHFDERFTWAAGFFRRTPTDSAFDFREPATHHLTARLTGLPLYLDDGRLLVHTGIGYTHQFHSGNDAAAGVVPGLTANSVMPRFRTRPEAHLSRNRFVGTPALPAHNVDQFNLELATVMGPFHAEAEYTHAVVAASNQPDPTLYGVYAQIGVFLTGESRAYSKKSGSFGRTKPKRNFDPRNGGWGAVELALRYSMVDLQSARVFGGREDNWTVGLNWTLFPNARLMFNYVHADVEVPGAGAGSGNGSGGINIAQARLALDF